MSYSLIFPSSENPETPQYDDGFPIKTNFQPWAIFRAATSYHFAKDFEYPSIPTQQELLSHEIPPPPSYNATDIDSILAARNNFDYSNYPVPQIKYPLWNLPPYAYFTPEASSLLWYNNPAYTLQMKSYKDKIPIHASPTVPETSLLIPQYIIQESVAAVLTADAHTHTATVPVPSSSSLSSSSPSSSPSSPPSSPPSTTPSTLSTPSPSSSSLIRPPVYQFSNFPIAAEFANMISLHSNLTNSIAANPFWYRHLPHSPNPLHQYIFPYWYPTSTALEWWETVPQLPVYTKQSDWEDDSERIYPFPARRVHSWKAIPPMALFSIVNLRPALAPVYPVATFLPRPPPIPCPRPIPIFPGESPTTPHTWLEYEQAQRQNGDLLHLDLNTWDPEIESREAFYALQYPELYNRDLPYYNEYCDMTVHGDPGMPCYAHFGKDHELIIKANRAIRQKVKDWIDATDIDRGIEPLPNNPTQIDLDRWHSDHRWADHQESVELMNPRYDTSDIYHQIENTYFPAPFTGFRGDENPALLQWWKFTGDVERDIENYNMLIERYKDHRKLILQIADMRCELVEVYPRDEVIRWDTEEVLMRYHEHELREKYDLFKTKIDYESRLEQLRLQYAQNWLEAIWRDIKRLFKMESWENLPKWEQNLEYSERITDYIENQNWQKIHDRNWAIDIEHELSYDNNTVGDLQQSAWKQPDYKIARRLDLVSCHLALCFIRLHYQHERFDINPLGSTKMRAFQWLLQNPVSWAIRISPYFHKYMTAKTFLEQSYPIPSQLQSCYPLLDNPEKFKLNLDKNFQSYLFWNELELWKLLPWYKRPMNVLCKQHARHDTYNLPQIFFTKNFRTMIYYAYFRCIIHIISIILNVINEHLLSKRYLFKRLRQVLRKRGLFFPDHVLWENEEQYIGYNLDPFSQVDSDNVTLQTIIPANLITKFERVLTTKYIGGPHIRRKLRRLLTNIPSQTQHIMETTRDYCSSTTSVSSSSASSASSLIHVQPTSDILPFNTHDDIELLSTITCEIRREPYLPNLPKISSTFIDNTIDISRNSYNLMWIWTRPNTNHLYGSYFNNINSLFPTPQNRSSRLLDHYPLEHYTQMNIDDDDDDNDNDNDGYNDYDNDDDDYNDANKKQKDISLEYLAWVMAAKQQQSSQMQLVRPEDELFFQTHISSQAQPQSQQQQQQQDGQIYSTNTSVQQSLSSFDQSSYTNTNNSYNSDEYINHATHNSHAYDGINNNSNNNHINEEITNNTIENLPMLNQSSSFDQLSVITSSSSSSSSSSTSSPTSSSFHIDLPQNTIQTHRAPKYRPGVDDALLRGRPLTQKDKDRIRKQYEMQQEKILKETQKQNEQTAQVAISSNLSSSSSSSPSILSTPLSTISSPTSRSPHLHTTYLRHLSIPLQQQFVFSNLSASSLSSTAESEASSILMTSSSPSLSTVSTINNSDDVENNNLIKKQKKIVRKKIQKHRSSQTRIVTLATFTPQTATSNQHLFAESIQTAPDQHILDTTNSNVSWDTMSTYAFTEHSSKAVLSASHQHRSSHYQQHHHHQQQQQQQQLSSSLSYLSTNSHYSEEQLASSVHLSSVSSSKQDNMSLSSYSTQDSGKIVQRKKMSLERAARHNQGMIRQLPRWQRLSIKPLTPEDGLQNISLQKQGLQCQAVFSDYI